MLWKMWWRCDFQLWSRNTEQWRADGLFYYFVNAFMAPRGWTLMTFPGIQHWGEWPLTQCRPQPGVSQSHLFWFPQKLKRGAVHCSAPEEDCGSIVVQIQDRSTRQSSLGLVVALTQFHQHVRMGCTMFNRLTTERQGDDRPETVLHKVRTQSSSCSLTDILHVAAETRDSWQNDPRFTLGVLVKFSPFYLQNYELNSLKNSSR